MRFHYVAIPLLRLPLCYGLVLFFALDGIAAGLVWGQGGSVGSDRIRQRQELGLTWSCPKDREVSQKGAASILYATSIFSDTKKLF